MHNDHLGTKDDSGSAPSTRVVAAALAGMAAAWLAAGSTGLLAHPLRHGLTWVALAVAVLGAWPRRPSGKERWLLAGSLVVAAAMIAPVFAVYNVLGVSLVLALLARTTRRSDRRLLLVVAQAACVLAVYLLARTSIATVWSMADALGGALGLLASRFSRETLSVGASFAGLDFLVLMAAVYAGWLVATRPPRLSRAFWAAAAILGGHLAYLVLLSHATDLYDALPEAPPPPEFRDYVPPPWSWSYAVRGLLPWNVPLVAGMIQLVVAGAMFRWAAWLPAADGPADRSEPSEIEARRAGVPGEKQRKGKQDERKRNAAKQPPVTHEPDPSPSRLQHALAWAPLILAALVPLLITLAPGKSSLVGKKIVAYQRGYLDWEKPVHDSYGQASAGMYGMLPEFIDSLGGRFERSLDLAQADLADADVLLLIHPVHPWTPDQLERIWDFVRRGGSLLVVAETMLQEDDLASSFNEVLE
ncbi:MAG: hypothetical protein HQ582_05880, partial [Planctomycetes bacterium]|nr:hypothetical protein [Planctomycetota bacterium]